MWFLLLVFTALFVYYLYTIDVFSKFEQPPSSISLPPPPPTVTPVIIVDNVTIGDGMYYDIAVPEIIVSVYRVEDGMVAFLTNDGGAGILPISDFVVNYSRREQTRIATL